MATGNPTLATLDDAAASVLQDQPHAGTGAHFISHTVDQDDVPSVATKLTEFQNWVFELLANGGGVIQGRVLRVAALTIGVFLCNYRIAGADKAFAGETGLVLAASDTHYVWLDAAATLQTNTTGFPADVYRLAIVVTGTTDITSITDVRMRNTEVGGTNAWYNVAAAADVDLNGSGLLNIGSLDFAVATELTLDASGEITPTQALHTVDTYFDVPADELKTITATAGRRDLLILRRADPSRTVTVKNGTGNITLLDVDAVLDDDDKLILLLQTSDTGWTEVTRNFGDSPATLTQDMDANGKTIDHTKIVGYADVTEVTINSGLIGVTQMFHSVDTEGDAASDNLDMIDVIGIPGTTLLILRPVNAARKIVVTSQSGNIKLATGSGTEFEMWDPDRHFLFLKKESGAVHWIEVARSPRSLDDLVGTTKSVPYTPVAELIPSTLVAGVQSWTMKAPFDFVIRDVSGSIPSASGTAPTGGSCIIHVLVNTASIFANDTEAINITDSNWSDTSATKDHLVTAGDILTIEVKSTSGSPNGAAKVSVTINGAIALQAAP